MLTDVSRPADDPFVPAIRALLSEGGLNRDQVAEWLDRPNRRLARQRPVDLLAEGRSAQVLAVVRRWAEKGYPAK